MSELQNLLHFFCVKEKKGSGLQSSLKLNANNCWMRKQQTKGHQQLLPRKQPTKGYQQFLPSFRRQTGKRLQEKKSQTP